MLSEGQYVTNIEKMSDIWWYGTNAEGFHGLFPSNHVEVVDDSAAEHQLSQMPPTTAIVTFDYDRAEDNEIDLREGERIEDIDRVDKLWWLGTNEKGQRGVFPSNVSVQSDYQSTDSDQIDLVAGELKKGERGLFPKDLTQVVMEERSTGS
ncbi:hypothetical protein EDB81DRAFT_773603 [Dactylonectria macrodidyma]|uniref:SH3 domain-containing protein n=1 Tax=Dactylonectria macrodidyma TaxID=307937 RepID=A0A9P9FVM3_9HYPO|nr:hypothetical protein EDB81DRAFT_773603 [Dactylonectria macrodidyma]